MQSTLCLECCYEAEYENIVLGDLSVVWIVNLRGYWGLLSSSGWVVMNSTKCLVTFRLQVSDWHLICCINARERVPASCFPTTLLSLCLNMVGICCRLNQISAH